MSFAVQFTPEGPIAPTYEDILAYLKQSVRAIYGADMYLDSDSQDGQMIAVLAKAIKDQNDAQIATYLSFSPATALGVGLSNVVKINGIRRLVSTNSQVVQRVVGQVGTQIYAGQVSNPNTPNVRWALPDLVEIPDAGFIDVTATCLDSGAALAQTNSLTRIVTPTRGWQSTTNPSPATPGMPVESDVALRQRQSVSTAIPALSVKQAILGAIKNIIGVGRAVIYENDTDVTDGDGIPAHSICVVAEGGDIDLIAAAIARYKTPGTGTYGDTEVTVPSEVGPPLDIRFDELALVDMAVLVVMDALAGYVNSTGDLIKASIVEFYNSFAIGQDSAISKLWSPVNLTGGFAVTASGKTQAALDALSDTYNALRIYQARPNMNVVNGPYAAGTTAIDVTNGDDYTIGDKIAVALDDGSYHYTTVANVAADTVTMLNAVPGGRTIDNGVLMYLSADVTVVFNEAATSEVANITLEVS